MNYLWLLFALGTILCWGSYGPSVHTAQAAIGGKGAAWKVLLLVGTAYFLLAVLVPSFMIWKQGLGWDFGGKGLAWGLLTGTLGAIGALCVIGAMINVGKAGVSRDVVMPIIFGCAPVITVCVSWLQHPPTAMPKWQFFVGILALAVGAAMVLNFQPKAGGH